MTVEIDGVTVMGTPYEIAELMRLRGHGPRTETVTGTTPVGTIMFWPPPCTCGQTAKCQRHKDGTTWVIS